MLRIIITDDHAVVRQGIKQILAADLEIDEIAEASNAEEAMSLVRDGVWDLLILDITMPGRSGLEVLRDVRDYRPNLPVLVLSMYPESLLAVRALKAGAAGYVTKASAPEELIAAVRRVLDGGRFVSSVLAEKLVLEIQAGVREQPHDSLSNREFEVMRQIASGNTVSEIAEMLSLSVKTVSTYRARILAKMSMKGNAELTRYAIQKNLVD